MGTLQESASGVNDSAYQKQSKGGKQSLLEEAWHSIIKFMHLFKHIQLYISDFQTTQKRRVLKELPD